MDIDYEKHRRRSAIMKTMNLQGEEKIVREKLYPKSEYPYLYPPEQNVRREQLISDPMGEMRKLFSGNEWSIDEIEAMKINGADPVLALNYVKTGKIPQVKSMKFW